MRKVIYVIVALLIILVVGFVLYPIKRNEAAIIDQTATEIKKTADSPAEEKPLTAQVDPNPFVQQLVHEYEQYVSKAISKRQAPGAAVVIVRDSSIIFIKGFGLKEAGTNDSVDVNSVFSTRVSFQMLCRCSDWHPGERPTNELG